MTQQNLLIGRWRFKMDFFSANNGAGNDLHRAGGVVPPNGHADLTHAGVASWKQCSVPSEHAPSGERGASIARCVQYHVHNVFLAAIDRGQSADLYA